MSQSRAPVAVAITVALAVALAVPSRAGAQPAPGNQESPATERPERPPGPPEPKPYDMVITKDAKSDEGAFTVHRIKDKVYYEIPASALGKEFLWVSQIAKTTLGAGYGGQAAGNSVVKWERRDNRVLLRRVSYDIVADSGQPIARAVEAANFHPIVMAFKGIKGDEGLLALSGSRISGKMDGIPLDPVRLRA